MNFYVMKVPPFDVITGVPVLEALQGCLNFDLEQVTSVLGGEKATLLLEFAVFEVPVDDSLETDSE